MSSSIPPEQHIDPEPHQDPTQNFEPLPEVLDHNPEYLDKRASNTVLSYSTHFNYYLNYCKEKNFNINEAKILIDSSSGELSKVALITVKMLFNSLKDNESLKLGTLRSIVSSITDEADRQQQLIQPPPGITFKPIKGRGLIFGLPEVKSLLHRLKIKASSSEHHTTAPDGSTLIKYVDLQKKLDTNMTPEQSSYFVLAAFSTICDEKGRSKPCIEPLQALNIVSLHYSCCQNGARGQDFRYVLNGVL